MSHYWATFVELIVTPFRHAPLIWGIVPLYFGLFLNELTADKANFRTALQTGFSFLWSAAQWGWAYFWPQAASATSRLERQPINLIVTCLVLVLGAMALISGVRKKYPKHWRFLGHTRFANYFMITIYPIQAHCLTWTWERLTAIAIFAVPIWLVLHFGLMPVRK